MKETLNQDPAQTSSPSPRTKGAFSLQKSRLEWGRDFSDLKSLFETSIHTPAGPIKTYIHMLGLSDDNVNLIPFDDSKGANQEALAKVIPQGEIAIAIKHHSPKPDSEHTEVLKFQATHIQIITGVSGGAITINNPQGYCSGGFGDSSYPSIFIKPTFPKELNSDQTKAYMNNTRTWAVLINTFSAFPSNYNGSDPLKCITKEMILKFGKAVIAATLGSEEARSWLKQPEQMLYCAELAFVSFNLGLYFPLNKRHLEDDFEALSSSLLSKEFLLGHDNPHIRLVDLEMAPESLDPINEVIPTNDESSSVFWDGLVIKPFHSADIIAEFIKRAIPRIDLGEVKGSIVQVETLKQMRPSIYKVLNLSTPALRNEFDTLLDQTEAIVSTPYDNYQQFRAALNPILQKLGEFSLSHGMAYIPPHCFLLRAFDSISKDYSEDIIGWDYIGHGFDQSLFD